MFLKYTYIYIHIYRVYNYTRTLYFKCLCRVPIFDTGRGLHALHMNFNINCFNLALIRFSTYKEQVSSEVVKLELMLEELECATSVTKSTRIDNLLNHFVKRNCAVNMMQCVK